jgi:hypothetical protein
LNPISVTFENTATHFVVVAEQKDAARYGSRRVLAAEVRGGVGRKREERKETSSRRTRTT